jgi:hypothetical protein
MPLFSPSAVSTINFGSDALQKALDAAAGIPAGKRGYLDLGATTQGAQVLFGQRISPLWSVGAWGGVDWSGKVSAGLRVRGAW